MIIGLAYLLVLLSVPLLGGRLGALADLPLRRPSLALAAIAIQILVISILPSGDHTFHTTAHLASYVLLGAFAWANRGIFGVPIVAFGGLLNFIAIAANGGVMPTSPSAMASLARTLPEGEFANSQVIENARVQFLGDVFATPASWPLHNVFSVGDGIALLGVFVLVHVACGSRLVPRRFAAAQASRRREAAVVA
ncbi:MAG TPA: DUF5317 domain-containing protein [Solirubrobacter sp.]|nr:DUF5317 domain-containing protein [Solirubrobacter sp.]